MLFSTHSTPFTVTATYGDISESLMKGNLAVSVMGEVEIVYDDDGTECVAARDRLREITEALGEDGRTIDGGILTEVFNAFYDRCRKGPPHSPFVCSDPNFTVEFGSMPDDVDSWNIYQSIKSMRKAMASLKCQRSYAKNPDDYAFAL